MLFDLFSPGKAGAFAKALANDVAQRYPPAVANNPEQMISQKRLVTILEETFAGVHRFDQENRLGVRKPGGAE